MRAKKTTNKKTTVKSSENKKRTSPYNSRNLLILIPLTFVIAFTYYNQKPKPKNESKCKKSISSNPSILTPSAQQNPNNKETQTRLPMEATYTSINLTTNEKPAPRNKVWGVNGAQARKTAKQLDQTKLIADNSSNMAFQKNNSQCANDEPYYPSRLQIGPNYTRVNFKPDGSTSFNGNLWGAQGSYEYRPRDDLYAGATLAWKQGNTHSNAGSRYLLYIDTQERLGYTFSFEENKGLLTLFTGLGYRHLGHHLHPTTGDSLRFSYNEIYVPVGLLTNYDFTSWFSWGVGLTWMPQVFPTVYISPQHGNNWSLTYKLNNYFVEMPFDFAVTKNRRCHITFKPFYERWQDGHSTATTSAGTSLGLPGNTYNFWGADLNFGYEF